MAMYVCEECLVFADDDYHPCSEHPFKKLGLVCPDCEAEMEEERQTLESWRKAQGQPCSAASQLLAFPEGFKVVGGYRRMFDDYFLHIESPDGGHYEGHFPCGRTCTNEFVKTLAAINMGREV